MIKKLFNVLKNLKIIFKNPNQNNTLIYDRNIGFALKYYLDIDKIFVLDTRKESIYFFLLLKSFLRNGLSWNYRKYIFEVIRNVNPKTIITNVDNNKYFWKLKEEFKNVKTVFIQNGFRHNYNDIFSELSEKDEKKFFVDKMFVFNDEVGKHYSKYIVGETFKCGSLNNNRKKIHQGKAEGILFISEWGPDRKWLNKSLQSKQNFIYPEQFVFSLLVNFARKNEIKLYVLGRPLKPDFPEDKLEEYNFYSEIAGSKNWEYINTNMSGDESYNLMDNSEIIISISSTLGYEALARRKKTAFFSCRGAKFGFKNAYSFAWPSNLPNKGPFWSNYDDPVEFERIMNYLISLKNEDWNDIVEPYLPKCMNYDFNNNIFLNEMKNLNVPIKNQK